MNKIPQMNAWYLPKGFRSQSGFIRQTHNQQERKFACLLEVIAEHIKKTNSNCFASTERLITMYNDAAANYNVAPIKRRTIFNLLNLLEQ
ncbi:MAG: hypothetical protein ACRC9T_04345, partial [Vibrionaceae bacterium]